MKFIVINSSQYLLLHSITDESSSFKNLNDIDTSSYATFSDVDIQLYYPLIKNNTRFCGDAYSKPNESSYSKMSIQEDQDSMLKSLSDERTTTEQGKIMTQINSFQACKA